jgi:UDP-N-acetylglucosamine 1-carboxyvinyltransferase
MQNAPANTWDNVVSRFPAPDNATEVHDIPVNEHALKPSGLDAIQVTGGNTLNGQITISGAKNAGLKHLCAALLTSDPMQFTNMPVTLQDIRTLGAVIRELGVHVAFRSDGAALVHAANIASTCAPYDLVRKMRASILVLGPLLAREGHAEISMPGGCAIGTRPIDLHLMGFEAMGAQCVLEDGYVKATAPQGGLKGAIINFPKVSVGATENIMMAATLAKGETVLINAAREPEIVDQGNALIKMGAKIDGLGTSEIHIQGVDRLHGCSHSVLPDRIETGTFLIAVAMTGGEVTLRNVDLSSLRPLLDRLRYAGVAINDHGDGTVTVSRDKNQPLRGTDIMTEPHPGFPTDLQAQFMSMLTQCSGAGLVTETIFENRFMHVPELNRLGADITVQGNSAIVRGVPQLMGAEVMATDLRASVALILAGLVAQGTTTVNRIYHLDRGYERIVDKLQGVGAQISRVPGRPELAETEAEQNAA